MASTPIVAPTNRGHFSSGPTWGDGRLDTRSCLHEAHARASAPGLPPSLEGQKEAVTGPARRLSVEQDERACLFSKEDSYEKCVRACVRVCWATEEVIRARCAIPGPCVAVVSGDRKCAAAGTERIDRCNNFYSYFMALY